MSSEPAGAGPGAGLPGSACAGLPISVRAGLPISVRAGLPEGCRSVVVVGLGVMGGSVVQALRRRAPEVKVRGIDPSDEAAALAARDGVVRARGLAHCAVQDAVVVFAAPLDATVKMVESEARHWRRAALATDVASLKAPVVAAARRGANKIGAESEPGREPVPPPPFVGAHPICGSERSGYTASRADLFDGAPVWLCPAAPTAGNAPTPPSCSRSHPFLERAAAFWRLLGGEPRLTSPEAHDRAMSWTSHLPQLAAWALAGTLDEAGFAPSHLGPGGRDATRLAGSSAEMWHPLLDAAAKEDAAALAALEARIAGLRQMLEARDGKALLKAMRASRQWHAKPR